MRFKLEVTREQVEIVGGMLTSLLVPAVLGRALIDKRWRRTLLERAVIDRAEASSGQVASGVWFHAASVGEVSGIAGLVSAFRQRCPEVAVSVSTTSETGRRTAIEKGISDKPFLLPLDHPWCVRRRLEIIQPRLVVFAETEIWPNLLSSLLGAGIPVVYVNGRISDYSFPRYRRLRGFFRPLMEGVRRCFVQSELDKERFLALGARPESVEVTGSTKYDQEVERFSAEELEAISAEFGLDRGRKLFVVGCVRPGEEGAVLDAYLSARVEMEGLQLIFAPRHPERFAEAARILESRGLLFNRRSEGTPGDKHPILLLDTLGELSRAYALADVAFVGGTLVDIGGHNPLEPAAYGVPVLVGPHTNNIREVVRELKAAGGSFEVTNGRELSDALMNLLADEELRRHCGERAYSVWKSNQGMSEKVLVFLEAVLAGRVTPSN